MAKTNSLLIPAVIGIFLGGYGLSVQAQLDDGDQVALTSANDPSSDSVLDLGLDPSSTDLGPIDPGTGEPNTPLPQHLKCYSNPDASPMYIVDISVDPDVPNGYSVHVETAEGVSDPARTILVDWEVGPFGHTLDFNDNSTDIRVYMDQLPLFPGFGSSWHRGLFLHWSSPLLGSLDNLQVDCGPIAPN